MPKVSPIQTSFNTGEISPLMYGRVDFDKYKAALKTCINQIPLVQGGVTRRPGTIFVDEVKTSSLATRVFRFEFSTTQAYIIEFGNLYVRFYRNHGRVENPPGTPVEVVTPYTTAELATLSFTQSADVLYIAHPNHPPATLNRLSDISWTHTLMAFTDGPYLPQNTDSTNTFNISIAGTGAGVLTAALSTFVATDVGRVFRLKLNGQAWAWGTITAYTDAFTANVNMVTAAGAIGGSTIWRLGAWSATTSYPGCVTFFQDRLCWGGTPIKPLTLYMSVTGIYTSHQPTAYDVAGTVIDSYGINITLSSNDVQLVRWLSSDAKGLLVGTVAGEWIVTPSLQLGGSITPTNVSAVQMTAYGNAPIQPVRVGYTTLAVQRSLRKVRELTFIYTEDRYHAPDMTVLAQHVTYGGIVDIAYQQEPNSIVWFPRTDGTLLAFVYERDQNVVGWSRNTIGGTNTVVESVACIPAPDGTRNELWMVVKRTVGGVTKRYIEYMTKMWERGDAQADSVYVDCALQYNGVATTTLTNLTHLIGETVTVLADGAVHPDCVVDGSGHITLNRATSKASVGYRYNSDGQTLRNDAGAADGTSQGKTQRAHKWTFRLHDALSLKAGPDFTHLSPFIDRSVDDAMGQSVVLTSGDVSNTFEGDYSTENLMCWRFSDPLPGTILASMPQQHTMDA